jgi:hypothetical protein
MRWDRWSPAWRSSQRSQAGTGRSRASRTCGGRRRTESPMASEADGGAPRAPHGARRLEDRRAAGTGGLGGEGPFAVTLPQGERGPGPGSARVRQVPPPEKPYRIGRSRDRPRATICFAA